MSTNNSPEDLLRRSYNAERDIEFITHTDDNDAHEDYVEWRCQVQYASRVGHTCHIVAQPCPVRGFSTSLSLARKDAKMHLSDHWSDDHQCVCDVFASPPYFGYRGDRPTTWHPEVAWEALDEPPVKLVSVVPPVRLLGHIEMGRPYMNGYKSFTDESNAEWQQTDDWRDLRGIGGVVEKILQTQPGYGPGKVIEVTIRVVGEFEPGEYPHKPN